LIKPLPYLKIRNGLEQVNGILRKSKASI